ncbi:MAG: DedA family protein, partial [Candidatus Desulforudis sp.]|nr:DedA family protein [Desulforudis sp.]
MEALLGGLFKEVGPFLAEYGIWGLIVLTFAEASFLPVFPEVLLIPMSLFNPTLAPLYALAATLSSTAGGLFGRWLGLKAGRPLLERFVSAGRIKNVEHWFQRYGGWAVGLAALTPVPYKVFTIASGVFGVPVRLVFWGSLLGRGIRFSLQAFAIFFLGEDAEDFLTRHTEELTLFL